MANDVSEAISSMADAEANFLARCDSTDPWEWFGRLNGSFPFAEWKYSGSHMGVPIFEKLENPRATNPR